MPGSLTHGVSARDISLLTDSQALALAQRHLELLDHELARIPKFRREHQWSALASALYSAEFHAATVVKCGGHYRLPKGGSNFK